MTIKKKFGFIYKVYHPENPDEFYIGSTNDVERRGGEHKRHYKKYLKGTHRYISIYSIFKKYENLDDIVFETIDCIEYEVEDEKDTTALRMLEDEYIKIIFPECVNELGAYFDRKEYRKLNKDEIAEYQKEYSKLNKDEIAEYQKEYQKEYRELNKDKINEKLPCPICGVIMLRSSISRHTKRKHT